MKHVTEYLDLPLIEQAIRDIKQQRAELVRKNHALRQRMHRLTKLVASHKQIKVDLEGE